MVIRTAEEKDHATLWRIIQPVISKGDTYVFLPETGQSEMLEYWCGPDKFCYIAELEGEIVGTFVIKDNLPGLGAHVANASFMVAHEFQGRGIGKKMGAYALQEAKRLGYRAMQFNVVVKTNLAAVKLWERLGFEIIGEIPEAFHHSKLGFVNAYIMYRKL